MIQSEYIVNYYLDNAAHAGIILIKYYYDLPTTPTTVSPHAVSDDVATCRNELRTRRR